MCNNTYGVTVLDVLDRAKPKQERQKKLSGEGGYTFVSGQRCVFLNTRCHVKLSQNAVDRTARLLTQNTENTKDA